jgi:predicted helicase
MESIIQLLKDSVNEYTKNAGRFDIFDIFLKLYLTHTTEPVHSIAELREKRTTKHKGDLFERFCQLYLKYIKKYDEVWMLKELPIAIREALSLESHDVGIDLIAKKNGRYSAVQCKYKTPRQDGTVKDAPWIWHNTVNWSSVSTFYALCARTGPWEKHIVMTTAKSIKRMGHKNEKDLSICIGSFQKLTSLDFIAMYSKGEIQIDPKIESLKTKIDKKENVPSIEELRLLRLAFYDKK